MQFPQATVRKWAACALLCATACSGDDTGRIRGTRLTVHWEHMKDATATCHKPNFEGIEEGRNSTNAEPFQACRKLDDTDCYVYTSERTPDKIFGAFVLNCFQKQETVIDDSK